MARKHILNQDGTPNWDTIAGFKERLDGHDGSLAQIASKKIYAKDHGVKLDGVTDDTVALNNFFQLFGTGVELIVDNGVALVTGQLNLPGLWGSSTNNGVRKLTFDNASINYQGTSGKACLQIYNHQKSLISGLSILKSSKPTYVNFVGFWYSRFENFEVPQICFNKNTTDITATLSTHDSYTSVFERGVTYLDSQFYGIGSTGTTGGNINSISFNDCKFWGNQVTPNASYNLSFYGTSFQNFAFDNCDISYATTANVYIDVTQDRTARLNFYSCYFDSQIPLVSNYDFKGLVANVYNSQLSSSQSFYYKTKNKTSMISLGNYGLEADNLLCGGYNLAKNGDLALNQTNQGWNYTGNNTSGGGIGSPTISILSNSNTINGNSLQIVFAQTLQYIGFNGITVPFDGVYSAAVRLRKTSGNGSIQLGIGGTYTHPLDLTPFAINEEITISCNAAELQLTQGSSMAATLSCTALSTSLTLEIMEITIVAGTVIGLNMPVHPQANLMRTVPLTAPASLSNNGSFAVSGRSRTRIDNGSTSVTGLIINVGTFDNQEFTIINESSSATLTFAASGSNVADGSSDVINAGTARKFVWNAGKNLWYRLQ